MREFVEAVEMAEIVWKKKLRIVHWDAQTGSPRYPHTVPGVGIVIVLAITHSREVVGMKSGTITVWHGFVLQHMVGSRFVCLLCSTPIVFMTIFSTPSTWIFAGFAVFAEVISGATLRVGRSV